MIEVRPFGNLPGGETVTLYTIRNNSGESVELLDLGASIHSLFVKDAAGNIDDVALGVGDADELGGFTSEGVVIGRCANRIAFGRFELDGKLVQLEQNEGEHQLHSASGNWAYKMFRAETDDANNTVSFMLRDTGEGGFGSGADVTVRYTFDDAHRLQIAYDVTPDDDTVVNPTNHAYFNLSGADDAREHLLQIWATEYAPKGDIGMPMGEIREVAGTGIDFTTMRPIREATDVAPAKHADQAPEVDECYILPNEGFNLAAELKSEKTGRTMRVYTDMPALVLFTPTFRMPTKGKPGRPTGGYSAVCLETQFVINAVNCPQYRSPITRKGETFVSRTVYEFV